MEDRILSELAKAKEADEPLPFDLLCERVLGPAAVMFSRLNLGSETKTCRDALKHLCDMDQVRSRSDDDDEFYYLP